MSPPSRRIERVNRLVMEELATLLQRSIKDADAAAATVSGVSLSADLRYARIYVAPGPGRSLDATLNGLSRTSGFLKRELGRRLRMKYTPELQFMHDESFDYGQKIDRLIEEVAEENRERDSMPSNNDGIRRMMELISGAANILVTTHADPDGDAAGSALALRLFLQNAGKRVVFYHPEGVPASYAFLEGSGEVVKSLSGSDRFNMTFLVDTSASTLLPDPWPARDVTGPIVVIDHHPDGDIGDIVIRRLVAATGEIILDLADEAGWKLTKETAECLYTAILADTGSFRYANTSQQSHRAAARLLAAGVDPWHVATNVYESRRPERFRALAYALARLSVGAGGRYASVSLSREEIEKSGAVPSDLEGFVNYARAVRGVEVAAFLREETAGEIRVSLRSRGSRDVSRLAQTFGGGGHYNASGCLVKGSLEDALDSIEKAVVEILK